mmetsp:Transcript_43364/g.52042  ORF Transcript_43364/g.52042 Transcript_43364/m.52042 type:complete len:83 (-) Transcript_43364:215-463(-)
MKRLRSNTGGTPRPLPPPLSDSDRISPTFNPTAFRSSCYTVEGARSSNLQDVGTVCGGERFREERDVDLQRGGSEDCRDGIV